jgi:hypothetical protein
VRLIFAFAVVCVGFLRAADNPDVILDKIRHTVSEAVERSDNYICAQDLARFYFLMSKEPSACHESPVVPKTLPLLQDRLKLDVAVSQGDEIYSWHGEHKFSASTVGDVVRDGPISSGGFNGYLRNVFGERPVTFVFRGESTTEGLSVYNFDYNVPLAVSHYELQAGKGFVLAPFHGHFSASAATFELTSLTVTADSDQIPSKSNICSAQSSLTYQMVKIADHESLLPASFDLLMSSRNGVLTDSRGKYSGCREYTGESVVHFDMDDSNQTAAATPELESQPLKAGIYLPIALRTEIDEDTGYAGQPVEAVLTRKVKVRKDLVLARGAVLHGTVTKFEIYYRPTHSVVITLHFNTIDDANRLYLCAAIHYVEPQFLPTYARRGRFGGMSSVGTQGEAAGNADGSFDFDEPHMHLGKTFESTFITVNQRDEEGR